MNRKFFWLIPMLLLLVVSATIFWLFFRNFRVNIFTEGSKSLDNPSRGYYWQVDSANFSEFTELEQQGFRIVFLAFDISDFSDCEISPKKLEELSLALQMAKEHHLSVVFRAAYGFEKIPQEPDSLEQIGRHVEQIARIINDYADNLICIQAGLLGSYGEWHSGKYLSEEGAQAKASRLYLLKQWETYLDSGIQVALRRPRFIREAVENGIMMGRLTFHNDALVSTDNDMGTYDDKGYSRVQELEWVSTELLKQKIGGEMPMLGELSRADKANEEFQKLHLSYLNRSYQQEVFNDWLQDSLKSQNAEQYIQNHIGYRWYLSSWKLPKRIPNVFGRISGLSFEINFVNSGYAPLDDRLNIYLLVQRGNERLVNQLESEQSAVSCNGQGICYQGRVPYPQSDGEIIDIGIKIAPNVQETDEKNCVKLANESLPFDDGIYWIASYKENPNGTFILQN